MMNFEEVRRNPVYFRDQNVVDGNISHRKNIGGQRVALPPEDYDQHIPQQLDLFSPRRSMVIDGNYNIPGNVTMDAVTTNQYMDLDKTHLSHSNLKATINAEIQDMKRKTEGQVTAVQTDDHQSFCPETIIARLNFDLVNFRIFDVKEGMSMSKEPLEFGQVCLTEKRIFFVSRRRANYINIHIDPERNKVPIVTSQPKADIPTSPRHKPSSYRLQMEQNIGSSYYEMIPVWNVKSVSMNTSGKSTSHILIYSKRGCCSRYCGCCSCARDLLEMFLCETCMLAPGKTWHSSNHGRNNLLFENDNGMTNNFGSLNTININRKVLINAILPAWEQKAMIEIIVDAPTSIDKIADFIRLLQNHAQLLNTPTQFQNHGSNVITISSANERNNGFVIQGRR